jgi:NitT/TauT family transport system permease protein
MKQTQRLALRYGTLFGAVVLLILGWHGAALLIDLPIILPTPGETFRTVLQIVGSEGFAASVWVTVLRGFVGFLISALAGSVLGALSGRFWPLERLLEPAATVVRSTPVMSVILLALIWFPTGVVPVFVSLLVSFPIMYANLAAGVREVDPALLEMARSYRVPRRAIVRRIVVPSLFPYFMAGGRTALGLTWKVVVAAEVLSQPMFGIGAELQEARVLLDTARVLAWTAVAIVLSALSDTLFHLLTAPYRRRVGGGRG